MIQTLSIPQARPAAVLGSSRRRGLVSRPIEVHVSALYDALSRAYRTLDARAAAACFSPDAVVVQESTADLRGRAAIEVWLVDEFRSAVTRGVDLGLSFLVVERGVQNGVVFDVGTFSLTGRGRHDVSRVPLRTGRFLAVCRRDAEGRPRIVRLSMA
jgi:ketosteroid isomerase-like protein